MRTTSLGRQTARGTHCGILAAGILLLLLPSIASADVGPVPQWIWSEPHARPVAVGFEKSFDVDEGLKTASLEALADPFMRVWLDDEELFAEGVKSSKKWIRIDLSTRLKPGTHRIQLSARGQVGSAGVCLRLRLDYADGRRRTVITNPTWSVVPPRDVKERADTSGVVTPFACGLGLVGIDPWGDPEGEDVDYHQWKKSLGIQSAESAASVQVLPGFEVELIRSAQAGESSWISLTFDPQGRLIIGREGRDGKHGLLRLTLPASSTEVVRVESLEETLLEPRGLAFLGNDLFVNANNALSFVRLRDSSHDGSFKEHTVLKKSPGGVGHGRNNVIAGPDGKLYLIHGNDVRLPDGHSASSSRPALCKGSTAVV